MFHCSIIGYDWHQIIKYIIIIYIIMLELKVIPVQFTIIILTEREAKKLCMFCVETLKSAN